MIINIRDDIIQLAKKHWLRHLLIDRTTGGSILWGTDAYMARGEAYERNREIKEALILVDKATVIETRSRKTFEEQNERTKKRAEVFTSRWICTKMNNFLDEEWIAEADFFKSHNWNDFERQITKVKRWKAYVNNRRLEITCGEAPYLVSRYDAHTGEVVAVEDRDGLLDRKLRIISHRVRSRRSWIAWAKKACQSIYGYEFQGDNLLIARINVLKSIEEHFEDKWKEKIPEEELEAFIPIITWNLWQMDGLQDAIPYREDSVREMDLFSFDGTGFSVEKKESPQCLIMDWEQGEAVPFATLKGRDNRMKFDYIIGNPPYQESDGGGTGDSAKPVYNKFLEQSEKIVNKGVSMIMPSRWMKGGKGLNDFRKKMIENTHIRKLVDYENYKDCFPGAHIDGGICYLMIDLKYNGKCNFIHICEDGYIDTSLRYLKNRVTDNVIRDSRQLPIIEEVNRLSDKMFDSLVSVRKPYGIATDLFNNPKKYPESGLSPDYFNGALKIYGVKGNKGGQSEKLVMFCPVFPVKD